jgi:hypothetical protein
MKHLFLDCDGVLADFDRSAEQVLGTHPRAFEAAHGTHEFWKRIHAAPDFYFNLEPMPHAHALFNALAVYNPTILTGVPQGGWASGQKLRWRDVHFPGVPMITCASRHKRDFGKPGDVLVDDMIKHAHLWRDMGGVFIHAPRELPLCVLVADVHEVMKEA